MSCTPIHKNIPASLALAVGKFGEKKMVHYDEYHIILLVEYLFGDTGALMVQVHYYLLWVILTYCVLFWLTSWNFIGLRDVFCKDALCIIHQ